MHIPEQIKVVAFDADDTLWVNETRFRDLEMEFVRMMTDFVDEKTCRNALFQTEIENMEFYGYGVKPFVLSVIETGIQLSNGQIPQQNIAKLIALGKDILNAPIELLPGAQETLNYLQTTDYRLVLATKGDALDQERKLRASGLEHYFDHVEVMSDKQLANYELLLRKLAITPEEFLMIGNSVKSDVLPVIALNGQAVHIPFHTTWEYEQVSHEHEEFHEFESLSELLNSIS
ncbi:MAG: HAD family hydrolase [Bacteroidales bacterium]|jgi:putative hydrolase of the HAD superfamily|nr:HAD family hydrolase [Bacteroidales bacterium]